MVNERDTQGGADLAIQRAFEGGRMIITGWVPQEKGITVLKNPLDNVRAYGNRCMLGVHQEGLECPAGPEQGDVSPVVGKDILQAEKIFFPSPRMS